MAGVRVMQDFLNNQILLEDMETIESARNNWERLNNTSICVTGAAGMIASCFVMFLIYLNEKKNFHIQIYAGIRSAEKAKKRFGIYVDRDYFHILSRDVIFPVDENLKYDYIVHAASLASPQYYGKMPVETMLPNIIGTYELLEYAKRRKIRGFLFFSSGNVYGSVGGVDRITEETKGTFDFRAIGNVYGESKRCGEALCGAYFHEYGVPVKNARIQHTYGPTLDMAGDKRVFSEFVNNIVNDQDIVLKSDGSAKRAFCYITDTVAALFAILLDGEDGESYNVGNDLEYISILELAEKLVALFPEKNLQVIRKKRQDDGYSASPENRTIPVSLEKTRLLGWKPRCSVEEGFGRTIQYFIGERENV